ncbi:MAG: thiolase domain-containing protein [Candidatus Bathyarchaeia archaeon]
MRKVAIIGVGNSKFGARLDVTLPELAFEAIKEAIDDAGLSAKDIEHVVVGSSGIWYEELLPAAYICEYAGLNPAGTVRCEAACATGSAAIKIAHDAVASGAVKVAMAVGVEKMTEVDTPTVMELIGRAGSYLWEFEGFGPTFPAYYAMHAVRHMAEFGTTEEQMGMVAVKNHKYGAINPKAHLQREVTLETVLQSRVVAWPLKLYDCCPISDGSAVVILGSEDVVKNTTDSPVWIEGIGTATIPVNMARREGYTGIKSAVIASERAYKMAGIKPEDVDVAEVHDCFTIAEIMAYEDLGFCKKGEGGKLIEDGQTYLGGEIPVNLSGGLKAKGHPLGATGCSMAYELVTQLRGEAGKRQASIDGGIALAHNVGGTGHYSYVTILGR